jgi:putative glutamine amidotransferase
MTRRPVIGLTSDVRVEKRAIGFVFRSYVECIEDAGGLPLQIPPLSDPAPIPQILDVVDGVVIVGGEDIDPRHYGEEPLATHRPLPREREEFDLALARALLDSDLPVLGICYGCQLLAVVSGGALHQDIRTQVRGAVEHAGAFPDLPSHEIEIASGSRLRAILGADRAVVNSAHHQAPRDVGAGLVVTATAPDGVIEGFEAKGPRFLVGVEWHPDLMRDAPAQRRLFEALVSRAAERRMRLDAPGRAR